LVNDSEYSESTGAKPILWNEPTLYLKNKLPTQQIAPIKAQQYNGLFYDAAAPA
jgi:hypothetical protein